MYEFEEPIAEKVVITDLDFGVGFRKGAWSETMASHLTDLGEDWILISFHFELWWVKKLTLFLDSPEITWDPNLNPSSLYVNSVP